VENEEKGSKEVRQKNVQQEIAETHQEQNGRDDRYRTKR